MVETLRLKLKEQKGFTLIELLAVIVILGIIAAIAIPAIGNVIKNSDKKAQVQEALLVIDAAKMYVADKHPTAETKLTLNGALAPTASETGAIALSDYLDRVKDKDFVVTVTYAASSGKYTYSIAGHDGVVAAGQSSSATEEQLLNPTP